MKRAAMLLLIAFALAFALALAVTLAHAADVSMTQAEKEACDREGGCAFVTNAWVKEQMRAAFEAGRRGCSAPTPSAPRAMTSACAEVAPCA